MVKNEKIVMNSEVNENIVDCVSVTVRFVSIMCKYAGDKREVQVEVPADSAQAIDLIINRFQIPWKDDLERSTRIFINQKLNDPIADKEKLLKDKDIIAFIPISGGG